MASTLTLIVTASSSSRSERTNAAADAHEGSIGAASSRFASLPIWANSKIGAFFPLLMATIRSVPLTPPRCRIAPERPAAI